MFPPLAGKAYSFRFRTVRQLIRHASGVTMIALALFVREHGKQRTPPFALDHGIACVVRLHE
jgi:hypothetical protein